MAKVSDTNDPKSVDEFIAKLDPDFARLINEIRIAILETDETVSEQMKWNSPAFFYNGEMKPFDPKEYKRDILVIHTRKNQALLIFPTGKMIDDQSGILQGDFPDARKSILFKTPDDFQVRKNDLKDVIKDWINKVEK